MKKINSSIITGHIFSEPKIKIFELSKKSKCSFKIKIEQDYLNSDKEIVKETNYFNVQMWNIDDKILKKGKRISLLGFFKNEEEKENEQLFYAEKILDKKFMLSFGKALKTLNV